MLASFICVVAFLSPDDDPKPKQPDAVLVTVRVKVPADTPKDAKVYLSGNVEKLGAWKSDAVPLKKLSDGRHAGTVFLPREYLIEYKCTLGTWERVEKDAKGNEIANRTLTIKADKDDEPIEIEIEVGSWAKPEAPKPVPKSNTNSKSTITGTLKTHAAFASRLLNNARAIYVWLPPDYDAEPSRRYPVAYFQDGQNVFDDATAAAGEWRADETADRLIREKKIPPVILVGVANTPDRMSEYTPAKDEHYKDGGKGPLYARFLIEELKPFIDKTYRTKPGPESTAVIGSSLGGLVAMETTIDHPDAFGLCGAVSPVVWWGDSRLIADVKAHPAAARLGRFWIDMGTREETRQNQGRGPAVDCVKKLAQALEESGLKAERDFHLEIVEGAGHNEAAWAARLDRILVYLFQ